MQVGPLNYMLELVVGVAQVIAIIVGLVLIKRTLEDRVEEIKVEALTFYAKEKQDVINNLPSLMADFGENLFGKFKGMIAGQASGIARLDKGLAEAMAQDAITGENPLLGMLLEKFPSVKKYIAKNPAAIGQLTQIAGQFMQAQGAQGLNQSRVPDRLRSMRY